MSQQPLRKNHHYLPCSYLKLFAAGKDGKLSVYRTLVSHAHILAWERKSAQSIAYQPHLYTHMKTGTESDEIECWFDREIEEPAAEPLRKATSEASLTRGDWHRIIRFTAAQALRTPARFIESQRQALEIAPQVLEETVEELKRRLQETEQSGKSLGAGPKSRCGAL